MTNPINYSNNSNPAYSGITINITSPTLNAAPLNTSCPQNCTAHHSHNPNFIVGQSQTIPENKYSQPQQYGMTSPIPTTTNAQQTVAQQEHMANNFDNIQNSPSSYVPPMQIIEDNGSSAIKNNPQQFANKPQETLPQAYPPQYYLNNYNYIQNGEKTNGQGVQTIQPMPLTPQTYQTPESLKNINDPNAQLKEEDMSSSKEIINELDSRVAEQKELEKNGTQTKVVALTNEYIMSLENYLNNPNTEIRLMASKEILTRLDEDKSRFDDAALNALLNKMLQDPEKLVRIAALSAFSSQLASGNDYTVKLLTDIQNNPNADKEDVLQAADSLLKMSSSMEIRYKPAQNNFVEQQQQVEQQ